MVISEGVLLNGAAKAAAPLAWRLAVRTTPEIARHKWVQWRQGAKCFSIPRGYTQIIVPEKRNPVTGEVSLSPRDVACSQLLRGLFQRFGFRENTHWVVNQVPPDKVLSDEALRQHNVVSVCGPGHNSFVRELLSPSRKFLEFIQYSDHRDRNLREFHWRNRAFRWKDTIDYVLIAVKRSPQAKQRKLVMIFGLRDVGTLAGGQVFALPEYRELRQEIGERFGSSSGEVEVLLRVDHTLDRSEVNHVRIATEDDGEPLKGATQVFPIDLNTRALQRIFHSVKQHPRPFVLSQVRHELTFTRDGNLELFEEATWTADTKEVVYYGKRFNGDPDLQDISAVNFEANITNGIGEVVIIPAESLPRSKRFLLFPIPPIQPGSDSPRVAMKAVWPGAAHRLMRLGESDEFSVSIQDNAHLSRPIDQLSILFRFRDPGALYRVTEQFHVNGSHRSSGEYGVDRPYEINLANVQPGQHVVFSVERVR